MSNCDNVAECRTDDINYDHLLWALTTHSLTSIKCWCLEQWKQIVKPTVDVLVEMIIFMKHIILLNVLSQLSFTVVLLPIQFIVQFYKKNRPFEDFANL